MSSSKTLQSKLKLFNQGTCWKIEDSTRTSFIRLGAKASATLLENKCILLEGVSYILYSKEKGRENYMVCDIDSKALVDGQDSISKITSNQFEATWQLVVDRPNS